MNDEQKAILRAKIAHEVKINTMSYRNLKNIKSNADKKEHVQETRNS